MRGSRAPACDAVGVRDVRLPRRHEASIQRHPLRERVAGGFSLSPDSRHLLRRAAGRDDAAAAAALVEGAPPEGFPGCLRVVLTYPDEVAPSIGARIAHEAARQTALGQIEGQEIR